MVVSSPTVEDGGRYGGRWRAVRDEVTEEAVVVAGNRNKVGFVALSLKSSLPETRRRRFIFALCDSSFLLDVNLFTFWTEETLIEDKSLSFCTCNGERWRRLFSFYKLLMILKETSDMENLLQFPFRSLRSYICVLNSVNKFVFSTGKELENIEQEKELDQRVVNFKFPVLIYQPATNSLINLQERNIGNPHLWISIKFVFLPFFCGIEGFVLPLDYERALKFSKRHKGNSLGHRDMPLEFDASLRYRILGEKLSRLFFIMLAFGVSRVH
ncbi:unnamed protein product [Arabidopsis thaliana]|uniref:Uncharacterized protein n=1 Tax=Arabidopsis thaliana TaxID=3702 RepID=A0A5S9XR59_ARATH|nr:unnamed protein product [Arabidopsis thaliana]